MCLIQLCVNMVNIKKNNFLVSFASKLNIPLLYFILFYVYSIKHSDSLNIKLCPQPLLTYFFLKKYTLIIVFLCLMYFSFLLGGNLAIISLLVLWITELKHNHGNHITFRFKKQWLWNLIPVNTNITKPFFSESGKFYLNINPFFPGIDDCNIISRSYSFRTRV